VVFCFCCHIFFKNKYTKTSRRFKREVDEQRANLLAQEAKSEAKAAGKCN
jgi:hypothetical protein